VVKGQPNRFVNGHGHGRCLSPEQKPTPPNPSGLCMCGCGEPAPIATVTLRRLGHVKGEAVRFCVGHYSRTVRGRDASNWRGGRTKLRSGYVRVYAPDHPRAHRPQGYVYEHILVAERVLGRHLPEGAVVHHINGDPSDNRPANLAILPSTEYHNLIHTRQRARDACGNPDWIKCEVCGEWGDPAGMYVRKAQHMAAHGTCSLRAKEERRSKRRALGLPVT
jgi:hypothetical protein